MVRTVLSRTSWGCSLVSFKLVELSVSYVERHCQRGESEKQGKRERERQKTEVRWEEKTESKEEGHSSSNLYYTKAHYAYFFHQQQSYVMPSHNIIFSKTL